MKRFFDSSQFNVTPLVAYGLVALFCIAGFLGLERYNRAQQDLESRLQTRQSEFATLQAIKNTDIWPARLEQSLAQKKRAEDKIWGGRTSGVIAAEFQQSIRSITQKHAVTNVAVSVDPEPSRVEGVEVLRFDLTGRIASGKDTIDFFADITSSERSIILTEMSAINSIRDKRPTYLTLSGIIPISVNSEREGGE